MYAYYRNDDFDAGGAWRDTVARHRAAAHGSVSGGSFSGGYYDTGMTVRDLRYVEGAKVGYTLAARFKYVGNPNTDQYSALVGGSDHGTEFFFGKNHGSHYSNYNGGDPGQCFGVQDGDYRPNVVCDVGAFDGRWHTAIFSEDAQGYGRLFVDGKDVTNGNPHWGGGAHVDRERVLLGKEDEGSGYVWRGSIATVAMYNGPKTPEEVLEIHQTMALSGNLCPAL